MMTKSISASRRHKGAFSLVELMIGMTVGGFVLMGIANVGITTLRTGNSIAIKTAMENSGRQGMDHMMQDIQAANTVIASYSSRSGATYQSNITDTLVLSVPSYNASGNLIDGTDDTIIYKLVPAQRAEEGPFVLQRIVEADSHSSRPNQAGQIVARNVRTARFTYLVHQVQVSNGLDLNIGLDAGVFGTGADLVEKVTVGGKPFAVGVAGQANIVSNAANAALSNLVLAQVPSNNAVIDILYSVAPWLLPKNVNVSQVSAEFNLGKVHAYLRTDPSTTVDLASSATLRNRS